MNLNTKSITKTGVLLALTLAIQFLRLPQFITGTAVNAMLLIAALTIGVVQSSLIGCITPVVALMVGIIKPPLAPAIPFIIGGNVILVVIFYYLTKRHKYIALVAAAFAKFLLLFGATKLILINMLPGPVLEKVAVTFGITQFFTALGGGIIALLIVPLLQNSFNKDSHIKE